MEEDMNLHHVKITAPDADSNRAKVEIDGQEVKGVTGVQFLMGIGWTKLSISMIADVEIAGDAEVQMGKSNKGPKAKP